MSDLITNIHSRGKPKAKIDHQSVVDPELTRELNRRLDGIADLIKPEGFTHAGSFAVHVYETPVNQMTGLKTYQFAPHLNLKEMNEQLCDIAWKMLCADLAKRFGHGMDKIYNGILKQSEKDKLELDK